MFSFGSTASVSCVPLTPVPMSPYGTVRPQVLWEIPAGPPGTPSCQPHTHRRPERTGSLPCPSRT